MSTLLHLQQKRENIWVRDEKDRFLVLHRPTGMWYVRAKRKGKRPLFKKTGYTQKGKAKTKALIMLAEWMGTRPASGAAGGDVILFRDFAADFREYIKKTNLRPRTLEQADIYLGELIEEVGYQDIRAINEGFVDEWLADFRSRKDRATFADYVKYLSKTLRHAHRKGLIDRLPQFRNPDPKKRAGRVYSHEEAWLLLQASDLKMEAQLRLCLQGFMRLREMLFLTWDRINLETGLVRLGADDVKTGSKTGEGRDFYVNDATLVCLSLLPRRGAYVFPSPSDPAKPQWSNKTAWRSLKRKVGVRGKASWHSLRHTALTWALVEMKMNPLLVSKFAGVSIRTIERVYLHIRPEDTRDIGQCIVV